MVIRGGSCWPVGRRGGAARGPARAWRGGGGGRLRAGGGRGPAALAAPPPGRRAAARTLATASPEQARVVVARWLLQEGMYKLDLTAARYDASLQYLWVNGNGRL